MPKVKWIVKQCPFEGCLYSGLNRTDYFDHVRKCRRKRGYSVQSDEIVNNKKLCVDADSNELPSVSSEEKQEFQWPNVSYANSDEKQESRPDFVKKLNRSIGNFLLKLRHQKHASDVVLNEVIQQIRIILGQVLLRFTNPDETDLLINLVFCDFMSKHYLGMLQLFQYYSHPNISIFREIFRTASAYDAETDWRFPIPTCETASEICIGKQYKNAGCFSKEKFLPSNG